MGMEELSGTTWKGRAELWEDPFGNEAQTCDCKLSIDDGGLSYSWSRQGKPQEGRLELGSSPTFRDSFHQQEATACEVVDNPRSLVTFQYSYMETWGWRINLCLREPTGELVLQMTNIAPWGEEARAVRMVAERQ